ncbi:gp148 [Bacillus phage G]|uniref:Gp148 n=1 Tax=Bacillus phage G TaxID=2884420 RepID=G3MBL4_9CAUD|nr:gp148 [Bacillus phage G]AEO93939.1 gp148 [Bacillus phage G]
MLDKIEDLTLEFLFVITDFVYKIVINIIENYIVTSDVWPKLIFVGIIFWMFKKKRVVRKK